MQNLAGSLIPFLPMLVEHPLKKSIIDEGEGYCLCLDLSFSFYKME